MVSPFRHATARNLAAAFVLSCILSPQAATAAETSPPRGEDTVPQSQAAARPSPPRGLDFLDDSSRLLGRSDAPNRPPERFALCIGINGYQAGSGYSPLEFAGQDAIGVAEVLLACEFDYVLLMTDEEAP